jgi:hypothetical protein
MLVGATKGHPLMSWQFWVGMQYAGKEMATDPAPPRADPSCGSLLGVEGSQYFVDDETVRMAMDGVAVTGGSGMCGWPIPQSCPARMLPIPSVVTRYQDHFPVMAKPAAGLMMVAIHP